MLSRNGKIARLPEHVRYQLNHRLLNGHGGPQLLAWLNGLPEVHAVLARDFAGSPIKQQNLSNWRIGAYREWCFRREILIAGLELQARSTNQKQTELRPAQANSSINFCETGIPALETVR
jgi:hypothetical protein